MNMKNEMYFFYFFFVFFFMLLVSCFFFFFVIGCYQVRHQSWNDPYETPSPTWKWKFQIFIGHCSAGLLLLLRWKWCLFMMVYYSLFYSVCWKCWFGGPTTGCTNPSDSIRLNYMIFSINRFTLKCYRHVRANRYLLTYVVCVVIKRLINEFSLQPANFFMILLAELTVPLMKFPFH